jgi:hypothetical protein
MGGTLLGSFAAAFAGSLVAQSLFGVQRRRGRRRGDGGAEGDAGGDTGCDFGGGDGGF